MGMSSIQSIHKWGFTDPWKGSLMMVGWLYFSMPCDDDGTYGMDTVYLDSFPPGFPSHGVMPTCFFGIFWRLPGANDEDRPRHRWWGTLVQHGSCGAPNPKDSLLHPGSARNKADWRPMLELPPVTAAYYCCNFGHIVLGHSGKRVPWDFCFFF